MTFKNFLFIFIPSSLIFPMELLIYSGNFIIICCSVPHGDEQAISYIFTVIEYGNKEFSGFIKNLNCMLHSSARYFELQVV